MTSWGHAVRPLTADELLFANRHNQTCASGKCQTRPAWATSYKYVTGRAGRASESERKVCGEHAGTFAEKHGLALTDEARRAAEGKCLDYDEAASTAVNGRIGG